MKLQAPEGVGDPCVDGVTLLPRDGVYEVEAEVGALLIECFGFIEVAGIERRRASTVVRRKPAAFKVRAGG